MLVEKCRDILIVLTVLFLVFYAFGSSVCFSEWLIKFLARSLPDKAQSREQEWLACLDECSTAREKSLYAASLISATVMLILSPPSPTTSQASIEDFFPPPKGFYPEPIKTHKTKPYCAQHKKPTRWSVYCDRLYLGESSVDYSMDSELEDEL